MTFATGFVASAVLAAIAGVMCTARTGVVVPGTAQPFLLEAVTAIYLGSVAYGSGRISVDGGRCCVLSLLENGLT